MATGTTPKIPIERLEVANFGCLRAVSVDFRPLTVLVGPNDSGKTMILRVLESLGRVPGERDQFTRVFTEDPSRCTFQRAGGSIAVQVDGSLRLLDQRR
jgi:predicted ATP-binding protein involved in virulence